MVGAGRQESNLCNWLEPAYYHYITPALELITNSIYYNINTATRIPHYHNPIYGYTHQ